MPRRKNNKSRPKTVSRASTDRSIGSVVIGTGRAISDTNVRASRTVYQVYDLTTIGTASNVTVLFAPTITFATFPAFYGMQDAYLAIRAKRVKVWLTSVTAFATSSVQILPEEMTVMSCFDPRDPAGATFTTIIEHSDVRITTVAALKHGPILLASYAPKIPLSTPASAGSMYSNMWCDTDNAATIHLPGFAAALVTSASFFLTGLPVVTLTLELTVDLAIPR